MKQLLPRVLWRQVDYTNRSNQGQSKVESGTINYNGDNDAFIANLVPSSPMDVEVGRQVVGTVTLRLRLASRLVLVAHYQPSMVALYGCPIRRKTLDATPRKSMRVEVIAIREFD